MKKPIYLCILQLTISSVFFVKDSFGIVSQACLDEIIKTNVMLEAITLTEKEANQNWNGKIKEDEITTQDVKFVTLIPKEDKTGVTTQRLIEDCQGKSGIFTRILIPTEDELSLDRLNRESKIQKVLFDVAGFNKTLFNRSDTDTLNLIMRERRNIYIGEINSSVRQYPADKDEFKKYVQERLRLLYKYINKEMKNRKTQKMCQDDSIKCTMLGLKKIVDKLKDTNNWFNHTAKCYEDIYRIRITEPVEKIHFKESYYKYIDEDDGYGNFVPTEIETSEANTSA